MRWLFWSLRSLFCEHEWEREEEIHSYHSSAPFTEYNLVSRKTVVSATCTKCGWHRSYKKFR